jgi:integrase
MSIKLLSIYKPNDRKNYMAIFMHNGVRKKKSLKTGNRKEAYKVWEEYLLVVESQKSSNFQFNIHSKHDFTELVEQYLVYRKRRVQASSFQYEKNHLGKFRRHMVSLAITSPGSIQAMHIDHFLESLEDDGRANKTINNYISLINTMFNYFVKKGYMAENCIDTKSLWRKKKKSKINFITMDEARMIIDLIQEIEDMDYRLFLLGPFYTGLRYSEIKALKKRNIDFENRLLFIVEKQTLNDPKPTQLLKSRAACRKVPILKEYLPLLEEYVGATDAEYIYQHISYKKIRRLREEIIDKIGTHFRFHDARHFFASILINNGFDLKKIQYILGHESIQMTVDIYGHLIEQINAEDFDRIDF